MGTSTKVVIIVALEREVHTLVMGKEWRRTNAIAVSYGAFESEAALVACAGIGGEAANKAAKAAIDAFRPAALVSAGFAGALGDHYKVGDVLLPASIIDVEGSPVRVEFVPDIAGFCRQGVLVSAASVAGRHNKRALAQRYHAGAVDMEAASVAQVAAAHGLPFLAIKAISDEHDFPMPDMQRFVDAQGRFLTARFVLHTCAHPRTWSAVSRLASNTSRASRELCRLLRAWLAPAAATLMDHSTLLSSNTMREQLHP